MKDKLTKHGKKSSYFKLRNFFVVLLVILGLTATVAIPVVATIAASRSANATHLSVVK